MMNQITNKEFFQIVKLLNGLEEDFNLGINCYNSFIMTTEFNLLFTKALRYEKRKRFVKEMGLKYTPIQLTVKVINEKIINEKKHSIYKEILLEIMNN